MQILVPSLGTNISTPKVGAFEDDDFPNFPFGGICDRSLGGFVMSCYDV